eukprot:gene19223-biopygen20513
MHSNVRAKRASGEKSGAPPHQRCGSVDIWPGGALPHPIMLLGEVCQRAPPIQSFLGAPPPSSACLGLPHRRPKALWVRRDSLPRALRPFQRTPPGRSAEPAKKVAKSVEELTVVHIGVPDLRSAPGASTFFLR